MPFGSNCRNGLNLIPELQTENVIYYQSLIYVFRSVVELGCIGICCEVSVVPSCLALSQTGHLEELQYIYIYIYIYLYLKIRHDKKIVLNPTQQSNNSWKNIRKVGLV